MEYVVKDGRNICHKGNVIIEEVTHRIDNGFVVCNPSLNHRVWGITAHQ